MRKLFHGIKNIISWTLTVALILVFVAVLFQKLGGEVPGVFGYHLMYVLTGSMEPDIKAGDAIIVREISGDTAQIGDVVCYYSTDEQIEGQLVTHEVVEAPYEQNGELYLRTKGVANLDADEPIRTEQVFGKMIFRLMWVGKLYSLFCTVPGLLLCIIPIILLMAGEFTHLVATIEEDKKEAVREAMIQARKEEQR